MSPTETKPRAARVARIVGPDGGRRYGMGRMRARFLADGAETDDRYSISEWWLEPRSHGPGVHSHDEDHVYYVLTGTVSVLIGGAWVAAERGSAALIPGGTPHDFENRGTVECGFLVINVPGGFEEDLPDIVRWFEEQPITDVTGD